MCLSCRSLGSALIAGCVGVAAATSHAQMLEAFPVKPIRIVVPFSVGSPSDALARTIGPRLSEPWGQPVVLDNRPGANGVTGTAIAAKATADGHTILITSASFVTSAVMHARLPYDPSKDFTGVMQLAPSAGVLVVPPSLGVKSLKEFIAFAKSRPGGVYFGSGGIGMGTYMNAERFRFAAGIQRRTRAISKYPAVYDGDRHRTHPLLLYGCEGRVARFSRRGGCSRWG